MLKTKTLALILCSGLLFACSTPSVETPNEAGETPTDSGKPTETDNGTNSSIVAAKDLKLPQFLNAMNCAVAKADASQKAVYSSQITIYSLPDAETQFNQIMQLGGGGQYVAYKYAFDLGCPG